MANTSKVVWTAANEKAYQQLVAKRNIINQTLQYKLIDIIMADITDLDVTEKEQTFSVEEVAKVVVDNAPKVIGLLSVFAKSR